MLIIALTMALVAMNIEYVQYGPKGTICKYLQVIRAGKVISEAVGYARQHKSSELLTATSLPAHPSVCSG